MIKVLGLGPGSKEALTLAALEALKSTSKVYLRTQKHPTVEYLNSIGVSFETYDDKYENSTSFDDVYKSIAEDLVKKHGEFNEIVYAVPGHPLVAEKSVIILKELCESQGIELEILPAVSFIDAIIETLKIDPVEGMKVIDAFDIKNQLLDKRIGTIVTQVYNKFIASEVKLALLDYYDDETELYFIRAAGIKDMESVRKMPLYELDRQEDIDYLTSLYIPRNTSSTKDFNDLLDIMDRLRGEGGCPWDREQNHESLKKYLIEESYEVLEAIDNNDDNALVEELGDVLLQVVFHAQISKEDGYFNINDVIKGICEKMIERHPHVFGDMSAENSEQVLVNWDKIKQKQQGLDTHTDQLKHVPKNMPALMRAEKVQKKAAKVGFDWDRVECAMDKVLEELTEVKGVYKGNNKDKILEEVGDLTFAVVNVARFLDIDPEFALNYTIDKFIKRFEFIENSAIAKGIRLEDMSLQEMDQLWEQAKKV
ncbi:MAG: nucleoside triphosphate pyrophosphohydrolase [Bacillota bacterium]|nr:nucleoside triphosphate pyrophosphohydrolase [Bacillota bacterium]